MPDIATRPLGRTGLEVTVLGFGAMELRGNDPRSPRPLPDEDAGALLNAVLDAGVNFIDTSIDYGQSEERIGRYISHRRSEYLLATKTGCPWDDETIATAPPGPLPHNFSAKHIREGLERSLTLLRTDHVDLLQLHMSPSLATVQAEDAIGTLQALSDEGKTRFIGSSSTLPNIWDHLDLEVFDTFQVPYSPLQRDHEVALTEAHQRGAGVIVRGGVAKGRPRPEVVQPFDFWDRWSQANLDELLAPGQPAVEFVLRYTLGHKSVSTVIVGTASAQHLADNLRHAQLGPLPDETRAEADRRLEVARVTGLPRPARG